MRAARDGMELKDRPTRFIAYLQAYTNTYAPLAELKKIYDEAVGFSPDVIGLMIGTRPDCITEEIAGLIASYARPGFELWVELGVQSVHDRSLAFLNRRHSHADSLRAIELLSRHGIAVCAHLILGIPGETWRDMMATAEAMNDRRIAGVKLHHLHVISGTRLAVMMRESPFALMECGEYVSTVCDMLERFRPSLLIHRLAADRAGDTLLAPRWGMHKGTVQRAIADELERRESYQGMLFQ
jgi:uncharacterized protein